MYEYIYLTDLRALLDLSSPCVWKYFKSVDFKPLYDLINKDRVSVGPDFPHPEIMGDKSAFRRNFTSKLARVDDVIGVILNEFNGNVYRRSKSVDLSDYVEQGREGDFREVCDRLLRRWCERYLHMASEFEKAAETAYHDFLSGGLRKSDYVSRQRDMHDSLESWTRLEKDEWFDGELPDSLVPLLSPRGREMYGLSLEFNARHRSEPVSVAMPGIVEDIACDLIRNQKENGLYNYKRWSGENDRRSREMMLREMWDAFAYEIHAFGKVFFVVDDTLYQDWRSWDRCVEMTAGGRTVQIEDVVSEFLHRVVPYSA